MNAEDARQLKAGDRVGWESSNELGTVTATRGAHIRVRWDDGQEMTYRFKDRGHGLFHLKRAA